MNINHIRYFATAVEHGSYSAAARQAGVTQPTISSAIKSLEKEFGSVLVVPTTDGLDLTVAGTRLLEAAQTLLGDVERMHEEMRRIKDRNSGKISIGIRQHLLTNTLGTLLDRFARKNPGIAVTIETADYYDLKKMLLGAELDFVIDHTSAASDPDGIESEHVMEDRLMVFMHPDHPESNKKELPVSIVNEYPHLYSSKLFGAARHGKSRIRQEGYMDTPPAMDIEDINLMANIVAGSDKHYVFIWSTHLFEPWLKEGKLFGVPLAGDNWFLPISVSYRSKRLLSDAAHNFIEELRTECQQLAKENYAAGRTRRELADA